MFLRLLTIILLSITLAPAAPLSAQAQKAAAQTAAEAASTAAEKVAIGTLIASEGNVMLQTPSGEPHYLKASAPIHLHDVIETGAKARALIVLIDNSEITLGENAQFTIDEYIFDETNDAINRARYSMLRGAFLYVSGLVAKKSDPRYSPDVIVNTPAASIGIRGTSFWGGEIDEAYGVLVTDGKVDVQTSRGRVNIDKGLGTTILSRNDTPAKGITWPQEKIDRAVATITMKDAEALRERITQNAAAQETQRTAYKEYLAARLEEQKMLKDSRTPSTRIDNRLPLAATPDATGDQKTQPTPAPVAPQAPAQTPAQAPSPVLEQQLEKLNNEIKDKGAENIPGTAPAPATEQQTGKPQVDLPVISQEPSPVPATKRPRSKADSAL